MSLCRWQKIHITLTLRLKSQGWTLTAIINTHSNADHDGGNTLLQNRLGCAVYATPMEKAVVEHPILEPSFLYGGYPFKKLRNKFLMATPSKAQEIADAPLPEGMEIFPLGGHFWEMIGVKTPDDVYFLADCVFGENTIQKYHISFNYDVAAYFETLDFVEIVQSVCEEWQEKLQNGIRIRLKLEEAYSMGDIGLIVIVIQNLLTNAVKFSRPYGVIDVKTGEASGESYVQVTDYGIGIAKEHQEQIFQRFYKCDKSRNAEGFGLGLALSKKIAEKHGGRITVISELGKGSTFTLYFPVQKKIPSENF